MIYNISMVYLVDDDVDDLDIMKEALYAHSYKGPVSSAANGKMLLDKLSSHKETPDVIVMDLNMPVKNGFETLKEIKANSTLKDIPVIILTASSNKMDEARCYELGCDYYYNKPMSISDYVPLVQMIKRFIAA